MFSSLLKILLFFKCFEFLKNEMYSQIVLYNFSETFSVDNCWARFVVFLFVYPHGLESR